MIIIEIQANILIISFSMNISSFSRLLEKCKCINVVHNDSI